MVSSLRLLALLSLLAAFLPAGVAASPEDWDLANGHFFGQTGYSVHDAADGRYWSEFRRLGGVDTLGYPVSRSFAADGFHCQAFQRAILQWRPDQERAVLANALDWLTEAGQDPWLDGLGIPGPLSDSGGEWGRVVAEREGWLVEPAISRAYLAGGGMERFGLPQSRPERRGAFVVQRFQRMALQLWVEPSANMPAPGSVVGILVGDLVKQVGIIPGEALATEGAAAPALVVERPSAAVESTPESAAERAVLDSINRSRAENGLAGVLPDGALRAVALAHARDMATRGYFDHVNPDGLHSYDRLKAAGVRYTTMGENLGWGKGYGTPSDAVLANHQLMMDEVPPDDGHRRIILNPSLKKVGIGVVVAADGRVYFAADFTD